MVIKSCSKVDCLFYCKNIEGYVTSDSCVALCPKYHQCGTVARANDEIARCFGDDKLPRDKNIQLAEVISPKSPNSDVELRDISGRPRTFNPAGY